MGFQNYPFTYGQATCTGTATSIVAANQARQWITVVNLGTTDVYIGDANVTTSTGQLLAGIKGASLTMQTTSALYGITSGSSQAVSYMSTQ